MNPSPKYTWINVSCHRLHLFLDLHVYMHRTPNFFLSFYTHIQVWGKYNSWSYMGMVKIQYRNVNEYPCVNQIHCNTLYVYLGHLTHLNNSMSHVWKSPVTPTNELINVSYYTYECIHEPSCHTIECMRHENAHEWMFNTTKFHLSEGIHVYAHMRIKIQKKGLCTFSVFTDAQVQVHNTEPRIKFARVNIIHYLGHLWFCDISMWTSPITYMNALMNVPCHKYKCTHEPSSHADQYMRHKNSYERLCHVTNMHNGFPDIFTTLSL